MSLLFLEEIYKPSLSIMLEHWVYHSASLHITYGREIYEKLSIFKIRMIIKIMSLPENDRMV